MAPYIRVARQEPSASQGSGGDATAEGGEASFMEAHSKEIYIGLAVLAALIAGYFLWAGTTHRLSFPPFNQKRSVVCKKGISKDKKEDEDYFKNDQDGGKGWICKECQEKRESDLLEKELKEKNGKSSSSKTTSKASSGKKEVAGESKRKSRVVIKKVVESVSEDDELDYDDEDEDEERRVGRQTQTQRQTVRDDNRKSKAPPPPAAASRKKRYESEVEYETDTDDYLSSDEEDEKDRRRVKDSRR